MLDKTTIILNLFHARGISASTLRAVLATDDFSSSSSLVASKIPDPEERKQVMAIISNSLRGETVPESRLSAEAQQWALEPGQHILLANSSDYPPLLKEIPDYPPLLFVRGDVRCLKRPMIAVVGSRNSTAYGRSVAGRIASDLARLGLVVCSGLATGIDTQAHSAAIAAGIPTVAVLGNGLSSIYPAANQKLAAHILDQQCSGALVSELPLAAGPVSQHFPQRNRIISGMSLGTLVVEASMRSGSLITARLALEQNREVFAVPGSVNSPVSRGCHRLIRQGAVLTESAEDVAEHIRFLCQAQLALSYPDFALGNNQRAEEPTDHRPKPPRHLKNLLSELTDDPATSDELMSRTGLDLASLSSGLLELQLAGLAGNEGTRWWRLP